MPGEYYLLIDGVQGESQQTNMTNNIELDSWNVGASSPASVKGQGLSAGTPSANDFSCTFALDSASATILNNLYTGKAIGTVTFSGLKSTGDPNASPYMTITFTDCYITSVNYGGSAGGGANASLSFAYTTISYAYSTQSSGSGSLANAGNAMFNVATGKQS
jgi:type VI secretion system secreted protein Hcp